MLPSLVVDEVRRGVAETLRTQFEPSTELFRDGVRRLIEDHSSGRGDHSKTLWALYALESFLREFF